MTYSLSTEQNQKLNLFLDYLDKWNKIHNVTAIQNRQERWVRHVEDSLSIIPFLKACPLQVDVGSGNGFPGIVMALMQPHSQISLIEKNFKKTVFLKQVAAQLDLRNITIMAEDVNKHTHKSYYDALTARAFTAPEKVLSLAEVLLKPNAKAVLMLSNKSDEVLSPKEWEKEKEQKVVLKLPHKGLSICRKVMSFRLKEKI